MASFTCRELANRRLGHDPTPSAIQQFSLGLQPNLRAVVDRQVGNTVALMYLSSLEKQKGRLKINHSLNSGQFIFQTALSRLNDLKRYGRYPL